MIKDHKVDNRQLSVKCFNCDFKCRSRKELILHLNDQHDADY